MPDFMPTTEELRERYRGGWTADSPFGKSSDAAFDCWLRAEKAKAWDEAIALACHRFGVQGARWDNPYRKGDDQDAVIEASEIDPGEAFAKGAAWQAAQPRTDPDMGVSVVGSRIDDGTPEVQIDPDDGESVIVHVGDVQVWPRTVSAEQVREAAEVLWDHYGEDDPDQSPTALAVARDMLAALNLTVAEAGEVR